MFGRGRDVYGSGYQHYKKLYDLNNPNPPDFYGSPYLQSRVEHAYKVVIV